MVNGLAQGSCPAGLAAGGAEGLCVREGDPGGITECVCAIAESPRAPRAWRIAFAVSAALSVFFLALIVYLVATGIGVWGLNVPLAWAFDVTNFVFWIGLAHAGTFISAILFLFRQPWRASVSRLAEAMTIFSVLCAAIFPTIHLGRIWVAYWALPYPNYLRMWPNFRSPLVWDVFAIGIYFVVSLLFWYLGMVPDLAALRDRARTPRRRLVYGLLALGWRGSARHWAWHRQAYLLLAGLVTALVISVHSVVSYNFAVTALPGWHSTIFPPYFVVGAVLSGLAMVLTMAVPARHLFGLKEIISTRHLEKVGILLLAMSCLIAYAWLMEAFTAWYSGNMHERLAALSRATGPLRWACAATVLCSVVVPQLLWSRRVRGRTGWLFAVALLVNVGMWLERFVIIVASLSRDYLPSSWRDYAPTWVEVGMLAGSFGLFLMLLLLFCRYLPMVALAELKEAASGAARE